MKEQDGTAGFLAKVVVASALLSVAIKYGGPLLPVSAPFTESLNGVVLAIVIVPSVVVGAVLLLKQRSA